MKRAILLLIGGLAVVDAHAAVNTRRRPIQAFTAVFWTETTLHSPKGKPFVFMQRSVYSRDEFGNVTRSIYRQTKGAQHDITAPLEHILTGSSSAQSPLLSVFSNEKVDEDADLGTTTFSGFPATGRRQILHETTARHTRTLETWFSAQLGLTVHVESRDYRGDTVVSDLSELHLGHPDISSAAIPTSVPTASTRTLYRALFTHIAHMERDRKATEPTPHINMQEIEAHLSQKMGLSAGEWQDLVDTSLRVDQYTQEISETFRKLALQQRAARLANPLVAATLPAQQASRLALRSEFRNCVQEEIDRLGARLGPDTTKRIEDYLHNSLATSISNMPTHLSRLSAKHAGEE